MEKKLLKIFFTIIIIYLLIIFYVLIDFHNDYMCSTGQDLKWFDIFKCSKYIQ